LAVTEVSTVVWLRNQVFDNSVGGVMVPDVLKEHGVFIFKGAAVQEVDLS
jgi:hypothetical protein